MIGFFRPHCACGGLIRKVEFYLDPFKRWDHYYLCTVCERRALTAGALSRAVPRPEKRRLAA